MKRMRPAVIGRLFSHQALALSCKTAPAPDRLAAR